MSQTAQRILFVYPRFSCSSYWGMQYILPLAGKRAYMPPLGLLTLAALTPAGRELRLVDLNCEDLADETLAWADLVCLSAMLPQRESMFETAARCRAAGKLVVFGGPLPTALPEKCRPHCDVLFRNEAEETWPRFLADLEAGRPQDLYDAEEKPDITLLPPPRFDLLAVHDYALIPIQYSRGCPYLCEFCDIIVMFGRRPRTKTPAQILAELDALERTGYRGMVFFADDNFIGNLREVRKLLPEMREWNRRHGTPFVYSTEASVNLADDREILSGMVEANFLKVFIGIETPSPESLRETRKLQNLRRSVPDQIREIQEAGLLPAGGFILGFDNDREDIFDRQVEFIAEAAIPDAMVNLLIALPGTPLYQRLEREGRLVRDPRSGEVIDLDEWGETNLVPLLPRATLLVGFARVLETLYTPRHYFERCAEALRRLPRQRSLGAAWRAFLDASRYRLSVLLRRRPEAAGRQAPRKVRRAGALREAIRTTPREYLRAALAFTWRIARERPGQMAQAFTYIAVGLHYHRFTFEQVLPALRRQLEAAAGEAAPGAAAETDARPVALAS